MQKYEVTSSLRYAEFSYTGFELFWQKDLKVALLCLYEVALLYPSALCSAACDTGVPCVLWDHLFKDNEQISALIALRTRAGLHSRSTVVIDIAEADLYMATVDDKCAPGL